MANVIKGKLVVLAGPESGKSFPFALKDGQSMSIGKASTVDISIPEDTVSRHHATLLVDGDRLLIRDEKSTNGTLVNGKRGNQTPLVSGDRIQLGPKIRLQCMLAEEAAEREQATSDRTMHQPAAAPPPPPAPKPSRPASHAAAPHLPPRSTPSMSPPPPVAPAPPPRQVAAGDAADETLLRFSRDVDRHFLSRKTPGEGTAQVEILGTETTVGRDESCHVVIPQRSVSKQHARLTVTGNSVLVEDLGSANGTFVNGSRVTRQSLKDGDTVAFDIYEYAYRRVAAGQPLPAAPVARADSTAPNLGPPPVATSTAPERHDRGAPVTLPPPPPPMMGASVPDFGQRGAPAPPPLTPPSLAKSPPPSMPMGPPPMAYAGRAATVNAGEVAFHGTGGALFKLMLVGYLLSLITFGVYSLWFTRNLMKYLGAHTTFRGQPMYIDFGIGELFLQILKLYLLTLITLGIYYPWAMVGFLRWIFDHSQVGRYRPQFVGSGGQLFVQALVVGLLSIVTLYIYLPWGICRMNRFFAANTVIGPECLSFEGKGGQLFAVMLVGTLLSIITFGIYQPWYMCKLFSFNANNTRFAPMGPPTF
ncbi:MAG: DUF898 family protein [Candidatus Schekmanbacteria bacterium]|nr:DUF898 family protein [Candidatus Schekmanbacteria bacterium]